MYNEASDVVECSETQGISGSTQHQFVKTGFGLQFAFVCFHRTALLLLLSLTCSNFVVSSVPAGCDIPLLLIILNQGGNISFSLTLSIFFFPLLHLSPSIPPG